MKSLEISGKTIDEAVQKALEQLGVSEEKIKVEVLKKGKQGILGLGSEEAKVKVTLLSEGDAADKGEILTISRETLSRLLELMGLEATIEEKAPIEEMGEPGKIHFNIEGQGLGMLIGRRGQTLLALQHILRLMVARKLKATIPINIDVQNYRVRREEQLKSLALRLAEQAKDSGKTVTMEPMPPNERRVIHVALSTVTEISTQSVGSGENRKVIIVPKNKSVLKETKEEEKLEGNNIEPAS